LIFFLLGHEKRAAFFVVKMGLDNILKVRNRVEEDDCIGHVDSFDVFDLVGKLKDLLDLLI
jgi:hypothetical protein